MLFPLSLSESRLIWLLPPTLNLKILQDIHFPYVVCSSSKESFESAAKVTRASHVEKEVGAKTEIIEKLQEALPRVHSHGQFLVGKWYEEEVHLEGVAGQVEEQVHGGDDQQGPGDAHLRDVSAGADAPLSRVDGASLRPGLGRLPVSATRRALPHAVWVLIQPDVHGPLPGVTRPFTPNWTRVVIVRHAGVDIMAQRPPGVIVNADSNSSVHRRDSHGGNDQSYERVDGCHDAQKVVVLRRLNTDGQVVEVPHLLREDTKHVEAQCGGRQWAHDSSCPAPSAQPVPLYWMENDDVPANTRHRLKICTLV